MILLCPVQGPWASSFLSFCCKSCPHLGRWLNANLNGQIVIAIWRIDTPSCIKFPVWSEKVERRLLKVAATLNKYDDQFENIFFSNWCVSCCTVITPTKLWNSWGNKHYASECCHRCQHSHCTSIEGYYVSVLQKLTGYRRIPLSGMSWAVKRTFLTGGFADTLSVFVKH